MEGSCGVMKINNTGVRTFLPLFFESFTISVEVKVPFFHLNCRSDLTDILSSKEKKRSNIDILRNI